MNISKTRLHINIPDYLVREIDEKMVLESYTQRQRSRWINEAIKNFLSAKDYSPLVSIATQIKNNNTKKVMIYMSYALEQELEEAVAVVRMKYPKLEGVKSLIVRASIIRRLLPLN